jgi:hypothetical protein
MAKSESNSNQCSVCKERFVVDSLARCCEMKHDGVVFVRRESQMPLSQKNKEKLSDSN